MTAFHRPAVVAILKFRTVGNYFEATAEFKLGDLVPQELRHTCANKSGANVKVAPLRSIPRLRLVGDGD